MLESLPISPQPNAGFSKNPQGGNGSQQDAGSFLSIFDAVAVRHNADDCSKGVAEEKGGGKASCKKDCEESKDSSLSSQSEEGVSEGEKPDKEVPDLETGTSADTSLPIEEDPEKLQSAAPGLWIGLLSADTVPDDIETSETLEGVGLLETPKSSPGGNRQNPIMDKANDIRVVLPLSDTKTGISESAKGQNISLEGKQNIELSTAHLTSENEKGGSFADAAAKLSGTEGQPADVKSMLKFDGKKVVNSESVEISHSDKGIENSNSGTVKASRLDGVSDVAKQKGTLNSSRTLDSPWTGSSKESGKFSYGKTLSDEVDRSRIPDKTVLSSEASSISRKAADKNGAGSVGEKHAKASLPPHGHRGDVPLEKNQTALKESMEIKAAAGNVNNAGDSPSVSKNSALPSDLRPVMESIPGEVRSVEKNDQNQKDSSVKTNVTSDRLVNVGEAETQTSKSGLEHREGQGEAEKRNGFQGKDFHGILEKLEVTKGEDIAPVSKARYGSNNGNSPVGPEIEKEIQRSSSGKENLGTVVRTATLLLKNGRQEARMALHPESLGHLKIRISTENHQVTVRVMADTVAAKELIEHNLHQLKADFQNQGLEITKFDVSLSQDSDRNSAGQNPSFASNRSRAKSGSKKEDPRQSEKTERTVLNANKARHNEAVDFFA